MQLSEEKLEVLREEWETCMRGIMESANEEIEEKCADLLKQSSKYTDQAVRTIMGPTLKESAQAKKNGANLSTMFNRL